MTNLNSSIEWTDTSWNPTTGCDKVSDGCDHCYAEKITERFHGKGSFAQVTLHPDRLDAPLRWRKPRRVFVNSMSDLFHKDVPDGFIAQVFDIMSRAPQHTFQVLTKRPGRMRSWMKRWADRSGDGAHAGLPPMPRGPEAVRAAYTSGRARLFADMLDSMGDPPEGCAYPLYDWMEGPRFWPEVPFNVWLGVSVEDQKRADLRIPALLDTPAAVRFLSCEPLLSSVDLSPWLFDGPLICGCGGDPGGAVFGCSAECMQREPSGLSWVICGGESGPGARPMREDWAAQLVTQCRGAGVPVFVKQMGSVWAREHGWAGKGGLPEQWPESLRVREFPAVVS